jgi:hypothetical protein
MSLSACSNLLIGWPLSMQGRKMLISVALLACGGVLEGQNTFVVSGFIESEPVQGWPTGTISGTITTFGCFSNATTTVCPITSIDVVDSYSGTAITSPGGASLYLIGGNGGLAGEWSITQNITNGIFTLGDVFQGSPGQPNSGWVYLTGPCPAPYQGTLLCNINAIGGLYDITPPLQIAPTSLPNATMGQPYPPASSMATITATGGSGRGYTWCVQSGSNCVLSGPPLPAGFTLSSEGTCGNACTDVVLSSTGSPAAPAGSYPFKVQVTDSFGNLATQALTLTVSPCAVSFTVRPYPGDYGKDKLPETEYAQFVPTNINGSPMSLSAAEMACQFTGFNWQQVITDQFAPSGIYPAFPALAIGNGIQLSNISPDGSLQAGPPYSDPPLGGYTGIDSGDPAYPFYLNSIDLLTQQTASTLFFSDSPTVPKAFPFAKSFTTSLVGISAQAAGPTSVSCGSGSSAYCTTLFFWNWQSDFNGTAGGVEQNKSTVPPDPNSGTGGVTITSINGVQLPTAVSPSQVATTASGLGYSRVSQTFNGTVTVTNIGSSAITGPLQIVFFGMPAGVTLVNATNNLSGTPYMTLPATAGLAPSQSATVSVQFKNPSNATINLFPVIYSGSIN